MCNLTRQLYARKIALHWVKLYWITPQSKARQRKRSTCMFVFLRCFSFLFLNARANKQTLHANRGYLSFDLGTELGTNISIRDICTDWNPSVASIHNPTV